MATPSADSNTLISIREFASLFGFTPESVIAAVANQRQRLAEHKTYWSIPELSERWGVSPAQVRNVLKDYFFRNKTAKIVNLGQGEKRQNPRIPAEILTRIEQERKAKMT